MAKQETIGFITLKSDTLVLADTFNLDERWVPPSKARTGFAVDISGPKAKYLVERQKNYKHKQLSDGTFRIFVPDARLATIVSRQAQDYADVEGIKTVIEVNSLGASRLQARDAARDVGVGMIDAREGEILAIQGKLKGTVELRKVLDSSGKITAIMIVL